MHRMKQRALHAWPWLWLWLLAATAGSPSSDTPVPTTLIPPRGGGDGGADGGDGDGNSGGGSMKLSISSIGTATTLPITFEDDASLSSTPDFRFTHSLYNVSISENSIGKTYVLPEERMGIKLASADSDVDIKFRIVSGDREKFFKTEERTVGDFCFLLIRTRASNVDVLNRERKDRYVLEVRATSSQRDRRNRVVTLEADTTVVVTILDTNDLNPLFYPIEYETTVTEDTPLHRSILRVIAEDADLGRNGEIYYSFAEETDQFAVHPVSGVITLTRPLR